MERHYTSNLLLKYLYHETSLTQTLEVENAIEHDDVTKRIFSDIKAGYKALPKVLFYPKETTVANILQYSAETPALDCY